MSVYPINCVLMQHTEYLSPPASPSMYVIWLRMTAVFRKPLSCTRKPFSVSFSSRSPGFLGALISLKAVAGIALSSILQASQLTRDKRLALTHGMVYVAPVRLSRTVRLSWWVPVGRPMVMQERAPVQREREDTSVRLVECKQMSLRTTKPGGFTCNCCWIRRR